MASRDKEYGRIRDTELDYMVVYPFSWTDTARVLNEETGVSILINDETDHREVPPSYLAVYNRYLKNQPKPWHEAKKNEVWDLEVAGEGTLRALVTEEHPGGRATFLIANLASIFGYTYSLTTNGEITGGTRVLGA